MRVAPALGADDAISNAYEVLAAAPIPTRVFVKNEELGIILKLSFNVAVVFAIEDDGAV